MSLAIWLEGLEPCDHCGARPDVGSLNITHNLSPLWRHLGCYDALYESHGLTAEATIGAVEQALVLFDRDEQSGFSELARFNPPNGWGSVAGARAFLTEWHEQIARYPHGKIGVHR